MIASQFFLTKKTKQKKSRLGCCYAKNSSKSGMYVSRSALLHFLHTFLSDFSYFLRYSILGRFSLGVPLYGSTCRKSGIVVSDQLSVGSSQLSVGSSQTLDLRFEKKAIAAQI